MEARESLVRDGYKPGQWQLTPRPAVETPPASRQTLRDNICQIW